MICGPTTSSLSMYVIRIIKEGGREGEKILEK
jgi:hypothetical protein